MDFMQKTNVYFSSEFSQGGFQKTSKPKKNYWDESVKKPKDKKKDYSEQRQKKRGEIDYA